MKSLSFFLDVFIVLIRHSFSLTAKNNYVNPLLRSINNKFFIIVILTNYNFIIK